MAKYYNEAERAKMYAERKGTTIQEAKVILNDIEEIDKTILASGNGIKQRLLGTHRIVLVKGKEGVAFGKKFKSHDRYVVRFTESKQLKTLREDLAKNGIQIL
jgi:nucleoid DNA-binding protein